MCTNNFAVVLCVLVCISSSRDDFVVLGRIGQDVYSLEKQ